MLLLTQLRFSFSSLILVLWYGLRWLLKWKFRLVRLFDPMDCIVHGILQGLFPTQGSNPGLPHCRQILYQLSSEVFKKPTLKWFLMFTKKGSSKWDKSEITGGQILGRQLYCCNIALLTEKFCFFAENIRSSNFPIVCLGISMRIGVLQGWPH